MSNSPPPIPSNAVVSSLASPTDQSGSKHPVHQTADAEQQKQQQQEQGEQQNQDQDQDEEASIPLKLVNKDRKGKGRARPEDEDEDVANNINNYDLALEQEQEQERAQQFNGQYIDLANDDDAAVTREGSSGAYPPMADDEMEERRVQETLKRWEEAERQRRKAARESFRRSSSSFGTNSSVVGDVTRKASKIWQDGAKRRASLRKGAVKLRDQDDSQSPFNDSNVPKPSVSSSRNTTLSLQETQSGRSASPSSPTPLVSQNPFHTPRTGSPTSFTLDETRQGIPFAPLTPIDSQENGALMQGTSNPPTPAADGSNLHDPEFKDRPILQASGSYSLDTFPTKKRNTLPTPRPLDLPKEVSPPPQPQRIPSPVLERSEADIIDDEELAAREAQQGRWWTDWICGCRESGRLGQDQAGRTNPFE